MNKLATIFLLAISTVLFAQDQVAKDVLDKLSATTKSYKNMTIGFDFIFRNTSQNINENQKGTLTLKGDNFRLEMEEQIIINDGESQWVYLKDMNEVQIMDHDPEDDVMSPNKLFVIYEEGYKYTYVGAESDGKARLHIIDLFPEESGPFIKIKLAIEAAKNQLNSITIFDKNGGTYSYKVNTFTTNSNNLAPFTFNLSKYPNVEVIDLR
mgnify:CR=1 FL=1